MTLTDKDAFSDVVVFVENDVEESMATAFRQLTAWQQPDNSISSVWQKIRIVLSKSAVVNSLIACCCLYGRILWQKHSIFGTLCFWQCLSHFLISVQKLDLTINLNKKPNHFHVVGKYSTHKRWVPVSVLLVDESALA